MKGSIRDMGFGGKLGDAILRAAERAGAQLEADVKGGAAKRTGPDPELSHFRRIGGAEGAAKRTGAGFNRGASKQDYATPPEFIDAVKRKFAVKYFSWDLAATVDNNKAELKHDYFGPDHPKTEFRNALTNDWSKLDGSLWLNPPFSRIEPWVKKSYESSLIRLNASDLPPTPRLFLLIPAAVGANWWARWVHKKCRVYFLNGRISFDGVNGYPKDCAICLYGAPVGYRVWRWKESKAK
jgi:hypothetical protein